MTPNNAPIPDPTPPQGGRTPHPIAGRIDPAGPMGPRPGVHQPDTPEGLNASPDMKALLRSLGRRWMLAAVLSLLLGGGAAAGAYLLLTPEYSAFSQVRVEFQPTVLAGEPERNVTAFGAFIKSQAALFKSRPIIQSALKKDDIRRLNLEAEATDLPAYIDERLQIAVQDSSELMTATINHRDPIVALALMKALTESYMEYVDYERERRSARDTELEKIITDLNAGLQQKKHTLREMAKKFSSTDKETLDRQHEAYLANVRDLRSQRNPIRNELARAEAALRVLDIQLPPIPAPALPPKPRVEDAQVETVLRADPVAGPYLTRMATAREVMDYYARKSTQPELETSYQRARSDLARMEPEVSRRRAEIRRELNDRVTALYNQEVEQRKTQQEQQNAQQNALRTAQRQLLSDTITEGKQQLAALEKEITDQQTLVTQTTGAGAETETLAKEIEAQEARIASLKERLESNKINGRVNERIHVHQEAALMRQNNRKQLVATLGAPLVVAGALCLMLAYFDYRQRRVYSAREVAAGLGIRVVGAVPALPGLERRLVDPGAETDLEGHPVLESIDALRTTLLRESQRERRRVILVTSAGAGEGKTTLAASLAISLARAGRRTLLVDGDLRSPAVNQLFEIPLQPGFSEIVLSEIDAVDAIQQTHVDNLFVLPAGQYDREVLQSLARDGLEGVLEKLREEYDFIVIDSHPVLAATDSLLLAQRVDGVLLAVLRSVSQMPHVYAAAQRLSSLGVRVLGAVINGSDPEEVPTFAPTSHPVA